MNGPNQPKPTPSQEVMISYKNEDKEVAFQIRNHLEAAGISCWIAPDCILLGDSYEVAVGKAIKACRAVVLVYSKVTEQSREVRQEMSMAFHVGKPIIPFQIADVEPDELFYVLASKHRLDAIPPRPAHYEQLVDRLRIILAQKGSPPAHSQRKPPWARRLLRLPKWAYLILFLSVALPLGYYKIIPYYVNKSLSQGWAKRNLNDVYETACSYQGAWYLDDQSIPTYWRVMAFQSRNYDEWRNKAIPRGVQELRLEYQEALRRKDKGSKQDDLAYQWAHFLRLTGHADEALSVLKDLQSSFPDSNWREGTAYYLATLCRDAGDTAGFQEQRGRLESFPVNAGVFDFERGHIITVREALLKLSEERKTATSPASAPAAGNP